MNMKKWILAATIMTMTAMLATGCGSDSAKSEQKLPDKIIIGLDDNFPPMGFRDESGNLVGSDIDLAKEAAKRLGIEVEFKPIDWDSKEAALKSKQVDMLWNGLSITEDRKKEIAFSDAYMKNGQIIVVRSDSPVTDRAGLAGKTLATQDGSSSIDCLNKAADFKASLGNVKLYGDNVAALMDLELGRVDAVLVDSAVGGYYMQKKQGVFKVIDKNMGEEEFGVGMRQEDTLLRDKLNSVLKQMSEDGTTAKISQKWFGEDISMKL